jgi:lipopolysaccharide/colanic/teichoic acid biosynthesis glycosyltransferase
LHLSLLPTPTEVELDEVEASETDASGLDQVAALEEFLPHKTLYLRIGKPLFDRVAGLILFALALPVMVILAAAVRITLGSSVVYRQYRVGRDEAVFRMYKFRTMQPDRREAQIVVSVERRVQHKTMTDPRHTPLGRFLRRRSLDELPQLWNVVTGDMSLVGPRPELPAVVARHYKPWQRRRHVVKPGLTGLWQVSSRNTGDGSLMYKHTNVDLEYIQALSFRTDLVILGKTLGVLLNWSIGGH